MYKGLISNYRPENVSYYVNELTGEYRVLIGIRPGSYCVVKLWEQSDMFTVKFWSTDNISRTISSWNTKRFRPSRACEDRLLNAAYGAIRRSSEMSLATRILFL